MSANDLAAQPWRMSGGDSTRRGRLPTAARFEPGAPVRLEARGTVLASPVFSPGGIAFVADMSGTIQAFAASGERRWARECRGPISATPVLDARGERLFFGTHFGWAGALDAANGTLVWEREIRSRSDPRILGDLLFVDDSGRVVLNSWAGPLVALDAKDGAEAASWDAGISPYAGASLAPDASLLWLRAVAKQGVQLVQAGPTGKETVLHETPENSRGARRTLIGAMLVVEPQPARVYFLVNGEKTSVLHAWSLATGSLLWSKPLEHCVQGTPSLREDGVLVIADLGGWVEGVKTDGTSAFRWNSGTEYLLAGGVSDAEGNTFLGDPLGRLHALDAQGKGRTLFEAPRSFQARPAFGPQGDLYMPCTDGSVYVFKTARA